MGHRKVGAKGAGQVRVLWADSQEGLHGVAVNCLFWGDTDTVISWR